MSTANTPNRNAKDLVAICAQHQQTQLADGDRALLLQWYKQELKVNSSTQDQFLSLPVTQWGECVTAHRAHSHPWYDFVKSDIDMDTMAVFLLENLNYPAWITLLYKILDAQFLPDSTKAVQENIDDEFEPEPHAELMKRLMMAIKEKSSDAIILHRYQSLTDRTLIFYYGNYIQPWHLVGSVFATEQMGSYRVTRMGQGLARLGLTQHELAFTTVHAECDDHHADDWLQRVIVPSIEQRTELKKIIATGIADCLETSAVYLDYLLARARHIA